MDIQIYREPCYLLEAAEVVYGMVNQIPANKLTAPGPYCIPPEEASRIQKIACAGILPDNEAVQFYFRGIPLEGGTNRLPCLATCLLYNNFLGVSHPDVDGMVQALSAHWKNLCDEGFQVEGINGLSLTLAGTENKKFYSLAMELMKLPIPHNHQMYLLEVFSNYDLHLHQVAELLRPVAEALPSLMEAWVHRAGELMDQWENFFRTQPAEEFFLNRARLRFADYRCMEMGMRYFSPTISPGYFSEEEGKLTFQLGAALQPALTAPEQEQLIEDWEYTALRLLANPARMEMLCAMMEKSMCAQELVQKLDLNPGSVFRDLNSLDNARLLLSETIDGRNYYNTNFQTIQQLLKHVSNYLKSHEITRSS